ncbi:MAG: hypothetical protein JWQ34_3183 [Mucilaginibacter sp.]|uniref:peroxiredoxin family protein n=1 Tax=Mucilaginibacter sp. TaxID=1882438 RepID=UPI0026381C20|nr:TlpA disulfide reductase family protein [Mucilaginibacter sp.]MDB5004958.1 hypothetical protein [Mucilaginibacter sp.]
MKRFFILCLISMLHFAAHSQDTSGTKKQVVTVIRHSVRLDTNRVVYDEQGNALHYYQYSKLLNSGDYTMRSTGGLSDATGSKIVLMKISLEQKMAMYQRLKTQMAIKNSPLRDGAQFDITPLLDIVNRDDLERKVIVLIFWDPDCPPCTEAFQSLNDFLKQIHNPEDLIVLAITNSNELVAATKLKQKPLLYAHLIGGAGSVSNAYHVYSLPSYVVVDKSRVVRFAVSGQSPITLSAFKDVIRQVLEQ